MKNIFVFIIVFFSLSASALAGVASDYYKFLNAKNNFHYDHSAIKYTNTIDVMRNAKVHSISRPFSGKCADFAVSLMNEIGGEVKQVMLKNNEGSHAILVKNGIVFDYLHGVMSEKQYNKKFVLKKSDGLAININVTKYVRI